MQLTETQRTNVTLLDDGVTTSDGFHKSFHSQGASNCVEVREGATTAIRDTQNRGLGHIGVTAGAWARTLAALR